MKIFDSLIDSYPIYSIGLSIGAFLLLVILRKISSQVVLRRALEYSFDMARSEFIIRIIRVSINISFLIALGIIWEVSLKGISLYLASLITILGVGLVANWSIVSNITASLILFFFFPFKIGSRVKILDGDNSVQGTVLNLSLFSINLELEDGTEAFYPNNVAIQKGIIHLSG